MRIELTRSQLQNIASLAIYYKNKLGINLTADEIIEVVLEMAASEACIRREHKRITNDLDARMVLAIMGATGKVTYGEE